MGFGHEKSPHGFIRDIRSTIRKATGAAPPSEYDGDDNNDVSFTYVDATGNEVSSTTKLTYKKYLQADALAGNRFNHARNKGEKVS